MPRPRLLDLFCGAGGSAVGYHDAGFEVVGIDKLMQTHYPYDFAQADALVALETLIAGGSLWLSTVHSGRASRSYRLTDFAGIHASPPCQAHSDLQKQNKRVYPDFIASTRVLLEQTGLPYVIENVEGAPLENPIMLCGTMFAGLRVIRHRLFESNVPLVALVHDYDNHPLVFTHDKRKAHHGKLDQNASFVQVTGGGNCTVANKADAMGISWMTGAELNEAIPPAYAYYVGRQLMGAVMDRELAA